MPYTADMASTLLFGGNVFWRPGSYTFSVPSAGSAWEGYTAGSEPFNAGYRVFGEAEAQIFRQMMAAWDELIVPDYIETDDLASPGNIRIAFTHTIDYVPGAAAYAYTPPSSNLVYANQGDVWFYDLILLPDSNDPDNNENVAQFSRIMSHELGHALGLNHPHDSEGFDPAYDTQQYSVMSYNWTGFTALRFVPRLDGHTPSFGNDNVTIMPTGPMVLDIAALQALYGADPDTRAGDTTYTWEDGTLFYQGLYDAGGVDTFDFSENLRGSIIDLNPGAFSSICYWTFDEQIAYWRAQFPTMANSVENIFRINAGYGAAYTWENNLGIAFNTIIENVIGGADSDHFSGNSVANVLSGGGGNDELDGRSGDDLLLGGTGDDMLTGGEGGDLFDYVGRAFGNDQILDFGAGDRIDLSDLNISTSPSFCRSCLRWGLTSSSASNTAEKPKRS